MFSLKNSIRRAIALTIASALATAVFVGCTKQDPVTPPEVTSAVTNELTPGINNTLDKVSNTLFHWVEEPAGAALAVSAADFLETAEYDTGETTDNYNLPIVVKDSKKYMHSGNLMLELTEDGDFVNKQDENLVRYVHEPDTTGGAKIYLYRNTAEGNVSQSSLADGTKLIERTDKFWEVLKNDVPLGHDEYVIATALEDDTISIPNNALVWYNGIATDTRASDGMIPLNVLTEDFMNILDFAKQDDGYVFTLYTGIGIVKITANSNIDGWTFKYVLPEGCLITHDDVVLTVDAIKESNDTVYVSADVLTKVFNYFVFSFSSVDMGDGSKEDIAVIVTDNQDILKSDKAARDEANRKAQEQQAAIDAMTATPEQEAQAQKDKQDRQEMEDNTSAYTTEGIPLTTNGDLTEPAKPTKNYKLPAGAQLNFTGDSSTALTTTLPDGCYWTPKGMNKNAFTDPAGNLWLNNKHPETTGAWLIECGYYSPDGRYHATQEEIDHAEALRAIDHDINVNGPTGDGTSNMSEDDADALWDMLGI